LPDHVRLGVRAAVVEGQLVPGDVEVTDGAVTAVGLAPARGDRVAVPGFVDLQVNGFAGVDFATADLDGYRLAGEALLRSGVTAFRPTFITAPEEVLTAAVEHVPAKPIGPRILGAHLEGPFLSPHRLGAHPAEHRRDPDPALLRRLLDSGPIEHVTLAPELPGALELVDELLARGITVACGHTNASSAEAHLAFDRGARTVTHLFNAMRSPATRDPGIVFAALTRDDVTVQLILDGHHVAAETALLAWRAAAGRLALVTDAVAAAGEGDGEFWLGSVQVTARDGVVRRQDGTLAGSATTMVEAVRNLIELGATLAEAVNAASSVPARIAGRDDVGVLAVGRAADVVVLDDALLVERVIVDGAVVASA
jgi:N-acetylglucosamine-6-phosphate deacetylase